MNFADFILNILQNFRECCKHDVSEELGEKILTIK